MVRNSFDNNTLRLFDELIVNTAKHESSDSFVLRYSGARKWEIRYPHDVVYSALHRITESQRTVCGAEQLNGLVATQSKPHN